MTDPISVALGREIKRAVAETLQESRSNHPSLPINKAAGLAMVRAHAGPEQRSAVVQEVCLEGLRRGLVLKF